MASSKSSMPPCEPWGKSSGAAPVVMPPQAKSLSIGLGAPNHTGGMLSKAGVPPPPMPVPAAAPPLADAAAIEPFKFKAAPLLPGPGLEPPPPPALNGHGLSLGTLPVPSLGTMPALSLEQADGGNLQLSGSEPQAKRLRSSREGAEEEPETMHAALAPPPPPVGQAEDMSWQEPWADVFMKLQEGDLEGRAGEYAEALVALRKQAETLRRQQETVKSSCEQLWHTAQREALLAHLKSLTEEAEAGVPKEVIEAARRAADEPVLPEPVPPPPGPPGMDPGFLSKLDPSLIAKITDNKVPFSGWDPNAQTADAEAKAPSKPRKSGWDMGPPRGAEPPAPPPLPPDVPPDVLMGVDAMKFMNLLETAHSNLYVTGLPESIDEASFRLLFAQHGIIISSKVMPDRKYGFVKFGRKEEAQRAIDALNGFEFNGLKLSVRFADRDLGQPNPAGNKGSGKGPVGPPPPVMPQVKLPPFPTGGGTAL